MKCFDAQDIMLFTDVQVILSTEKDSTNIDVSEMCGSSYQLSCCCFVGYRHIA